MTHTAATLTARDLLTGTTDISADALFGPIDNLSANASAAAAPLNGRTASGMMQVLYGTEGGDTAAISVNDIHQGQIGDCFMLSAVGELALFNPSFISHMITQNANGTETVRLYTGTNGGTPHFGATSFTPTSQVVTNTFSATSVNNGATQDVVGGTKEIWPQVIEKAYAQAHGGYGGIQNGGNPAIALMELTGKAATPTAPAAMTLAALTRDIAAGDLMVFDTAVSNKTYNLVGGHAYMFEALQTLAGVPTVKLGNPWGFDQPINVPVSQLAKAFVEIDVGHV